MDQGQAKVQEQQVVSHTATFFSPHTRGKGNGELLVTNICYDCMEYVQYLVYDKGTKVCQSCFHRRYYRKKWVRKSDNRKYTLKDLKQHLEKDWD